MTNCGQERPRITYFVSRVEEGVNAYASGYWKIKLSESLVLDKRCPRLSADNSAVVGFHLAAAFNSIESGDNEQAEVLAQALLEHASSNHMRLLTEHGHYLLGVVYYSRNELDAAERHLEQIVTNRFSAYTQVVRNGMIGLTRPPGARSI